MSGSMTGVEVMPISGEMNGQFATPRRHGGETVFEKAHLPQRTTWIAVSVEGIDAVVLGSNEEYIVAAFPWNLHAAEEERLGIDISVYAQGEDLPKVLNVYIARRQVGLVEIGAGARVVVLGGNHPLCPRQRRKSEDDQKDDRTIANPFPSALTHSESLHEDAPDRGGMDRKETMRLILSSALYAFLLCSIHHSNSGKGRADENNRGPRISAMAALPD